MTKQYIENLKALRQPLRWIEYSFSATLMILAISALSLVGDTIVLSGVVIATATVMLIGYFTESYNAVYLPPDGFKINTEQWIDSTYAQKALSDQRWLFIIGCFLYVFTWLPILATFADFVATRPENAPEPPAFVYALISSIFCLFTVFAIVQWAQQSKLRKAGSTEERREVYMNGEKWYIFASLVSKITMVAIVFAGYYFPGASENAVDGEGWTRFYREAIAADRCTKEVVFGGGRGFGG